MSESITPVEDILARLHSTPDIGTIVYPNTPAPDTVPRYEVAAPGGSHLPLELGGKGRFVGIIVITCVVRAGTGASADAMVETLQQRFPAHLTVGTAQITKLPEPANGFPDGNEFRVPVTITYRAFI